MYPVTHMTIGVGAVWIGGRIWRRFRESPAVEAIDYRFAALGALVPDIIDKPLARIGINVLSGDETAGHTIGHTLLVSGLLILTGILLARRGDTRLLVLGLGSVTHPLVDPTNTYPGVLFWPLYGWEFPESRQAWRKFAQIPLDIALAVTYAMLIWRSGYWRDRALRFLRHGEFPLGGTVKSEW